MHLLETRGVGDIVGLLEILEDVGKSVDIARLDDSLDEERSTLMNLLNDADALGLLDIVNGDIHLTGLGKEFLKANIDGRKEILKRQVSNVEPFNSLMRDFRSREVPEMSKEELEDFIRSNFPSEDDVNTFNLIIGWGRYTRLLDYDSDDEVITLL
ncbi:hypothetical protein IX51_11205 [uncultured archaeon]|nr:hypothetical protein IX51_11205 [uncultured archaeon]